MQAMKIAFAHATDNRALYLQEQPDSFVDQICQLDEEERLTAGKVMIMFENLETFARNGPFKVIVQRNRRKSGIVVGLVSSSSS